MLRVLIEKEIRDILGSTKFSLVFGICAILIVGAFYVGGVRYQLNQSHWEASKSENLRRFDGVTDWLTVQDTRIHLQPDPLACLVSGVSNDIGRSIEVTGRGSLGAEGSRYDEDPIFAMFRFLDLEFIFGLILSLLAILLCYDSICGEKEQGTLKLTFANAVPRTTYILGKLIGSFIALFGATAVAVGVGCLILLLMGIPMAGSDWLRLALVIAVGMLYFGVFLSVSVFVSASTRRSASAMLLLLVVWIASVLIVPRVASLAAGRSVDVPTVDEIASKKAAYAVQLRQEFMDAMNEFDKSNYDVSADQAIMKYMDSLHGVRADKMADLSARLNEERRNRQEVQHGLAFRLARVSPYASMCLAMTELAGSSLEVKHRFLNQAHDYQTTFADFTKEKTGMTAAGLRIMRIEETVGEDGREAPPKPEPIDATEIPEFQYAGPSVQNAMSEALPDLGLMVVFNLLFFVGSFVAFVRYDVR